MPYEYYENILRKTSKSFHVRNIYLFEIIQTIPTNKIISILIRTYVKIF